MNFFHRKNKSIWRQTLNYNQKYTHSISSIKINKIPQKIIKEKTTKNSNSMEIRNLFIINLVFGVVLKCKGFLWTIAKQKYGNLLIYYERLTENSIKILRVWEINIFFSITFPLFEFHLMWVGFKVGQGFPFLMRVT